MLSRGPQVKGSTLLEAAVPPSRKQFPRVMKRAVELAANRLSPQVVQEAAQVCRSLCWEITDYGQRAYVLFRNDGTVGYATSFFGRPDGTVAADAGVLHQAAFGGTSALALLFLTGRVRVSGAPAEDLDFFFPLLARLPQFHI